MNGASEKIFAPFNPFLLDLIKLLSERLELHSGLLGCTTIKVSE